MPQLNVPRNYANNRKLTKAILDEIVDSIETLVNSTLLDSENLDLDSIFSNVTATQADNIIDAATGTAVDSLLGRASSAQANSIITESTFNTDSSSDSDSRTISTSEQETTSITVSNTGFYAVIANVNGNSDDNLVTVRIKINGVTQKTGSSGLGTTSVVYIGTISTGIDVTTTLQRSSGSATAATELVVLRIA